MKKSYVVFVVVVLVTIITVSYLVVSFTALPMQSMSGAELERLSTFENGVLYQTSGVNGSGKFFVVNLQGTFREMGRQYGYLLKDQMTEFYDVANQRMRVWLSQFNLTLSDVEGVSKEFYELQPEYAKDLINGMAETSGLSLSAQKAVAVLPVLLAECFPGVSCSSMSAWGNYSVDGSTVVGRNWDLPRGICDDYAKYLTVVVYNPVGYVSSVAEINYVGCILLQSGMNSHEIFLDLQDGTMSDTTNIANRTPGPYMLFTFLLNSSTLSDIDGFFQASPGSSGLIINVADAERAYVYEWATYDVKARTSAEGIVASSNHFVDSSWTSLPEISDGIGGGFTKDRYANLLACGEQFKAAIDAEKMMTIFDLTLPNGGATFPDDSVLETYYQIVASPNECIMWLKAPGYSGWEKVDLKPLFQTPSIF